MLYDTLLLIFLLLLVVLVPQSVFMYLKSRRKRQRVKRQYDDLLLMTRHAQEVLQLHASDADSLQRLKIQNEEDSARFKQLFSQAIVAISFYDREGVFIDMNRKMRELVGIAEDDNDNFFATANLADYELIKGDFDLKGDVWLHACQHLVYPSFALDKYIEFRIRPVFDNGALQYYIMTARDITSERQLYLQQAKVDHELRTVNDQINEREQELSYLLHSGGLWLWRSDLAKEEISVSRSLKHDDYTVSFDRFLQCVCPDDYQLSMQEFNNMKGSENVYNRIVHMQHTPISEQPMWLSVTGVPVYGGDGRLTGHFGILRDVTSLLEIQEQLRRETARAEDSGRLKSAFLANMTHEIRTPLNAIVGFSDLLQVVETSEERQEFIRIIRNNCDMLIRLIDDIIEASSIDQGPLRIDAADVDFAAAFRDICQTLSQRVQNPQVTFIADNPYLSFRTRVDKGRLLQVITNFTTNAVKYTHEGHIKVGYRYQDGGIYMYCEDTGAGIPKDKQQSVFERFVKLNDFVQGTGLGLSICKNIAEACGGRIGVDSEGQGQGSTFWIWIPCECHELVLSPP